MRGLLNQFRRHLTMSRCVNRHLRRRSWQAESLEKRQMLAANFQLIKDINSIIDSEGSNPSDLVSIGSYFYFFADDGTHGKELWKSNGTIVGTAMVKDIRIGRPSSVDTRYEDPHLANVNGVLYFTANDGINGEELWKSDGTAAGTLMVKDIYGGTGNNYDYYSGSYDNTPNSSSPSELTNVNGKLYFTADDGANGTELWKSNGTAAGTVMVRNIRSGGGDSSPSSLTNVNGELYFTANDDNQLWKSNGTPDGTVKVTNRDFDRLANLVNVNGTLYFTAHYELELWKSNGTRFRFEFVSHQRQRHSFLLGLRQWLRTVEIERHSRRSAKGEGRQYWGASTVADQRQWNALFHGKRRQAWKGVVEVRRYCLRYRDGEGHSNWQCEFWNIIADQRQWYAVFHRQ
jgi:ELWxxDGT repeat protein